MDRVRLAVARMRELGGGGSVGIICFVVVLMVMEMEYKAHALSRTYMDVWFM